MQRTRRHIRREIAELVGEIAGSMPPVGGEVAWIALAGDFALGGFFGFSEAGVEQGISTVRFWSPDTGYGFNVTYRFSMTGYLGAMASAGGTIGTSVVWGYHAFNASAGQIAETYEGSFRVGSFGVPVGALLSTGLSYIESGSWTGLAVAAGVGVSAGPFSFMARDLNYETLDDLDSLEMYPMAGPLENWIGSVATGGDYPPLRRGEGRDQ